MSGYLFKIEDFIDLYRPEKTKMAEIRFPALCQSGPSTRQVLSFVENWFIILVAGKGFSDSFVYQLKYIRSKKGMKGEVSVPFHQFRYNLWLEISKKERFYEFHHVGKVTHQGNMWFSVYRLSCPELVLKDNFRGCCGKRPLFFENRWNERSCLLNFFLLSATLLREKSADYSVGVCVCVCVRACVRACVCVLCEWVCVCMCHFSC